MVNTNISKSEKIVANTRVEKIVSKFVPPCLHKPLFCSCYPSTFMAPKKIKNLKLKMKTCPILMFLMDWSMTTRPADLQLGLWQGGLFIIKSILLVEIDQWPLPSTAIVATELCLVGLTSVMVTTTVVCCHLQMDRTNVNIPGLVMVMVLWCEMWEWRGEAQDTTLSPELLELLQTKWETL